MSDIKFDIECFADVALALPLQQLLQEAHDRATYLAAACEVSGSENLVQPFVKWLATELQAVAGPCLYSHYRGSIGDQNNNLGFQKWSEKLVDSQLEYLFAAYPVLRRPLLHRFQSALSFFAELLQHISRDKAHIEEEIKSQICLQSAEFGLSDPHCEGKTVVRIQLNCGSFIFKPKSLANERFFFDLLLHDIHDQSEYFEHPWIISRSRHGWMQDLRPASSIDSANLDPKAQAAVGALMFLLSGTDLHYQNLYMNGKKICLFDLEAAFCALPRFLPMEERAVWRHWTILSVDLFRRNFGKDTDQADVSGFSHGITKPSFPRAQFSRNIGGGLEFHTRCDPVDTRPVQSAKLRKYLLPDEIASAIRKLSRQLNADRLLERMRHWEVVSRYVPRPTEHYYRLRDWLFQPRFLRSHDSFEEAKRKFMASSVKSGFPSQLAEDELRQLSTGDIPLFRSDPFDTSLHSPVGVIAECFFLEPGATSVYKRLTRIEEADIKRQRQLIFASIELRKFNWEQPPRKYAQDSTLPISKESITSAISMIANDVASAAVTCSDEPAYWPGYAGDIANEAFTPYSFAKDHYGGRWGILAFLQVSATLLGRECPSSVTSILCRETDSKLKSQLLVARIRIESDNTLLGLSGIGGELISKAILYQSDPGRWSALHHDVESILNSLQDRTQITRMDADVMSGSSGLLLALSLLPLCMKVSPPTSLVRKVAEDVINGLELRGEALPIGFAHGEGGAVAALCQAARLLDGSLANCAAVALSRLLNRIEFLVNEYGFLPDLRENTSDPPVLPDNWCHGASGLGVALLAGKSAPNVVSSMLGKRVEHEISKIVRKLTSRTRAQAFDCYCCGEAGEVGFLMPLSRIHAARKLDAILAKYRENRTFIGFVGDTRADLFPGLFQGASGIGYVACQFLVRDLPAPCGVILDLNANA